MNTEMLIELVRERSSLYDMSDKKYSDHPYKESLWREIASEINQPGMFTIFIFKHKITIFFYWSIPVKI
jgi:hypothetical protein